MNSKQATADTGQPVGAPAAGRAAGAGMRRYRWLVAGYAVSSYGSYLNMIALNLFVYLISHSALVMGLLMATRLAAGFSGGLVAGALVARFGSRNVMLWCNTSQAIALGLLVTAPVDLRWGAVVLLAVLAGTAGTVFLVALRSAVPGIVGDDRRVWANSLMVSGRSLAMVAGFLSAGLVVSLLGYRAAFLIDLGSFLACSAVVAFLRMGGNGNQGPGGPAAAGPGHRERRMRVALVALKAGRGLLMMVFLRAIDALGSSSHNAALPVYSTLLDPHHAAAFVSRFWTCWAVGNLLVQQLLRFVARRTGHSTGMRGFVLGTIAMSASFIAVFCGFPTVVTMGVALAAGMADGFTEVSYSSHLQALPEALRAHAFGISATAENLGFGVGMVVVASLLGHFAPLTVVGVSHGVAILVAAGFLAMSVKGAPRPAGAGDLPTPEP